MLQKYRNLKIRAKMIVGFTCVNVIFSLLLIFSMVIADMSFGYYEDAYRDYAGVAGEVAETQVLFEGSISEVQSFASVAMQSAVSGTEVPNMAQLAGNMSEIVDDLKERIVSLKDKIVDDDAMELYESLDGSIIELSVMAEDIIGGLAKGDLATAAQVVSNGEFVSKHNEVTAAFDDLYNCLKKVGEDKLEGIRHNKKVTQFIILGVYLFAMAVIVVLIKIVSEAIRIPIDNMHEGADALAAGDVTAEIKHYYDDEIGDLADALIVMQENIRAQAEATREVSEGNFSIDFEAHGSNDLLGQSMQTMINEENRVMGGIREAVNEIKAGSQEVASASQALAQGSTEQASAIQEITASITDITERTKINANDANTANNLVIKAKADANESTGKMKEMISAMAEINHSSEDISKIIKVIDDIAFQTNILALNAAVEAARAGAHGRGFAVVADEVRNLAGKSAQAASETAELIEDSINKVSKGSKLAEETAAALETIVEVIDKIVVITNSIAIASNDQATAISQIDQAIGQVSVVVQTNSATSEQCAAASEELSAQAGKLREMISRYKLKNSAVGYTPTIQNTNEKYGISDDEDDFVNDVPPVISLDEGFGKY